MDPTIVQRLQVLHTSALANALDAVGCHSHATASLRPVCKGFRFAGRAVTVREAVGDYGSFGSEDFRVGAMIDAAAPGDVIVVAADGARASTWGGMASLAAKLKGVAGLVVDGGVRDLEEIESSGFPVFARHLVPTTGRTRLKVEAIGEEVEIDGVPVAPGDVIVADGTGVVCVPAAKSLEIAEIAERCAADDARAETEIRNGLTFTEAMKKFTRI
ncbi:MAG: RraA family protein [Gammaproteobacteria bacterium]|nr:RraA family protein [Gammaproteobacteria bacterium]